MTFRSILILVAALAAPCTLAAQHDGASPATHAAPPEAKQFDFLVGQWELVVTPKVSGLVAAIHGVPKMVGTWKAWRAFDGWGIEDELRITDASGNPLNFVHATRLYDAANRAWKTSTVDVYRDVVTSSNAQWANGRMTTTTKDTDGEGKPYLSRVTYSAITPTSFRLVQERSSDDGRRWTTNLTIDGKRVAATAPR